MNHKRRGTALILNQIQFKKMSPRLGAKTDSANLEKILKDIGFDVKIYHDLNFKTIALTLEAIAEEDHTDADCLVVVAMSHGESRYLHATDSTYPVELLWSTFIGNKCPSLAGKPKLFFIQACRGTRVDNGVQMYYETDAMATFSLPSYADIMVAYSTYDGFYSFRNPDTGSWFIQALCQELSQHWRSRDLLGIMTSVVRRVAIDYQSFAPQNEEFHQKKQIPTIVSMLTRLVIFEEKGKTASTSKE
ncbi:Caspase [Eufriesea mexicana]|nr:Caspase [Eufriesea mexicana]